MFVLLSDFLCNLSEVSFLKEVKFELQRQKITPDNTVMDGCMIFFDIVSHISGDRVPIMEELSLGCSKAEPVELHVCRPESPA